MIKSYFIVSLRNLQKNKVYSFINILGLAIGIVFAFFIFQYVSFETSFDRYNNESDKIYRLAQGSTSNTGEEFRTATTFIPLGPILMEEFPQVVNFTRIYYLDRHAVLSYENTVFEQDRIIYADPSYFEIFTQHIIDGNKTNILNDINTAAISESLTVKYFGNSSPIGKTLTLTEEFNDLELIVKSVYKDSKPNSHLRPEMVVSLKSIETKQHTIDNQWNWPFYLTYVKLNNIDNVSIVSSKLPLIVDKYIDKEQKINLFLQPLTDIHLFSNLNYEPEQGGDSSTVYLLAVLGILVLIVANINYLNLSSAKSLEKVKEIGIRKALGSQKGQLVIQFVIESLILNIMALIFSFIIIYSVKDVFEELTQIGLDTDIFFRPYFYIILVGYLSLETIFSCIYPLLMITTLNPVNALKGRITTNSNGQKLRKVLVTFQFIISIGLLCASLTIYKQMNFMRSQPLGMDINEMLILKGPRITNKENENNTFKNKVLNNAGIEAVTVSGSIPGVWMGKAQNIKLVGASNSENKSYSIFGVGFGYTETYGLNLLAGRDFSEEFPNDVNTVIITKKAAHQLGFNEPARAISEKIDLGNRALEIIGVVDDYHHFSLKTEVEPIIMTPDFNTKEYFSIKLSTSRPDLPELLASIERLWKEIYPGNPFEYYFMDQDFNNQYAEDELFEKVFGIFTSLSILIACLGLFGQASYSISKRTKEIGIRKVLGSSNTKIFTLITKEFVVIILIASIFALPLTYFGLSKWIANYAFKISLDWWLFLAPLIWMIIIALITTGYHALKASLANPIDSIKSE